MTRTEATRLRQKVLARYAAFQDRFGFGPCGAVAKEEAMYWTIQNRAGDYLMKWLPGPLHPQWTTDLRLAACWSRRQVAERHVRALAKMGIGASPVKILS